MTREEAIKLIEHISIAFVPTDQYGDYDDPRPYEEALDMAIEALSDEAVQGDLIKRQDAIDTVEELNRKVNDGREFDTICTSDVIRRINVLPSADRPTGEVDAVAIYEKAEHDLEHNKITLGEFEKRIEPLKHLYYDRPTSEWILAPSVYKGKLWHLCPLCRHVQLEKTNYCPDCGVKMGGRAND